MASEDPFDAIRFELKRIEVRKTDAKETLGAQAEEKPPDVAVIRQVREGSPSEKCGLKVGDYPLMINGRAVARRAEVTRAINSAGDCTVFIVARRRPAPLETSTLKLPDGAERKADCEYVLRRLRATNPTEMGLEVVACNGRVCVKTVTSIGAANTSGIKVGDRILTVGDAVVRNVEHCQDTLIAAAFEPVDILIERQPSAAPAAPPPPPEASPVKPKPPPPPPEPDPLALSLGFQSVKNEVLGIPEDGIEPIPDDVQTLADKCRERVVAKLKVIEDDKSKSSEPRSTDKKVLIMSNISMKPLMRNVETSKK